MNQKEVTQGQPSVLRTFQIREPHKLQRLHQIFTNGMRGMLVSDDLIIEVDDFDRLCIGVGSIRKNYGYR